MLRLRSRKLEPEQCERLVALCEQVSSLLKFVGVPDEPVLDMDDLLQNAPRIASAYRLAHPETGPAPFSFSSETSPAAPLSLEVLYVDFVKLGSIAIGYYGLANVVGRRTDARVEWEGENVILKHMTLLHSLPVQYPKLIDDARRETECQSVFARQLEEGT
jgi:hypothetical protein